MSTVDVIVRATATRWVSEEPPGFVEVVVVDAHGATHRVVEVMSVLTGRAITAESRFPAEWWIAGEMEAVDGDGVRVRLAHGFETTDGSQRLVVSTADVVWL